MWSALKSGALPVNQDAQMKPRTRKKRPLFFFFACLALTISGSAQVKVVHTYKEYQQLVQADSNRKMVDIRTVVPDINYDLRYTTKENFTGRVLYKTNKTYLRLPPARALLQASRALAAEGYQLKIWDAYRPYAVTKKMWDLIGDERYVANPANGSGHNRGLSIDITLMRNGADVDMGTGFDNFSDTAHHDFKSLPADVLQRRKLLRSVMEKAGFRALETEWWHYSFPNDRQYDVLDLSFRKLGKR